MGRIEASEVPRFVKYDPETGAFTRAIELRCGKNNAVVRYRAGDPARGSVGNHRYLQIGVLGRLYLAHRLAFAYMTGRWPAEDIDHINGIRTDNRWANLREASRSINAQNKRAALRNNKTGVLGVSVSLDKFEARIVAGGEVHRLGRFETIEEASEAYLQAKRRLHVGCTI